VKRSIRAREAPRRTGTRSIDQWAIAQRQKSRSEPRLISSGTACPRKRSASASTPLPPALLMLLGTFSMMTSYDSFSLIFAHWDLATYSGKQ